MNAPLTSIGSLKALAQARLEQMSSAHISRTLARTLAPEAAHISSENGEQTCADPEAPAERKLPPGVAEAYGRLKRTLAEHPDIKRAVEVVDPDADPVLLAVAVRGCGYVCLQTPQAHYDGFKLLEMVHRWNVAA